MLKVENLYKSFGKKPALEDVSFSIEKGEIYGLLGHNGAGKSTSLGIILGMVAPDRGVAMIDGISVQQERAKALRKVGAIFEAPAFYDYLSGWENLRLLVGYSGEFKKDDANKVVEKVGLSERIHSKVRTYSHGMRQRLALAQALLPEPELLLLDEPTDGLDPEGIKWFRDFILELREKNGMTVLFNSHLLGEVEIMCDKVAILKKGRRVFEGTVEGLDEGAPIYRIDALPEYLVKAVIKEIGGESLGKLRYQIPIGFEASKIVEELIKRGAKVNEFTHVKRSLEDLYMDIRA